MAPSLLDVVVWSIVIILCVASWGALDRITILEQAVSQMKSDSSRECKR